MFLISNTHKHINSFFVTKVLNLIPFFKLRVFRQSTNYEIVHLAQSKFCMIQTFTVLSGVTWKTRTRVVFRITVTCSIILTWVVEAVIFGCKYKREITKNYPNDISD